MTGASFSVPFLLSVNSLWVWVTYFVADTHVRESLRVCEACFASDTHAVKSLWVWEACFVADTHTEKSLRVCEACLASDTHAVESLRVCEAYSIADTQIVKNEGITRKLYIPKRRIPGVCGAMSKMFVGGCWYFLEKCWKTGGKRTRCPRQPIVDMDVDCRRPRHDENYSSLFVENSHPETLHRDMCIACSGSSWILPMHLTNSQFTSISNC